MQKQNVWEHFRLTVLLHAQLRHPSVSKAVSYEHLKNYGTKEMKHIVKECVHVYLGLSTDSEFVLVQ